MGTSTVAYAQIDVSCEVETESLSEDFDDTDFLDPDSTSVAGWGSGSITLRRKGDTLAAEGDTIGLKVTATATADWDGDGFDDLVSTVLDTGCHLHFLRNRGVNADGLPQG
ncbi:MAG: hypothetical protein AAFQ82_04360, partial [Myxococcota bacterium]